MAQSSRHRPITREDFAEHVSEEMLMRLLEEHPEVGIAILSAREERQREVEAAEVAAGAKRARTEEEEALREMENAERARAEAELPRQTAVTMVKATTRASVFSDGVRATHASLVRTVRFQRLQAMANGL